eukprot:GILK01003680.1.p1 GENE.GILK01003680.1~~GILK01003680.1.p1  ORF type:complete len:308 (+),score=29.76 GILK01003680.1:48-971(+)
MSWNTNPPQNNPFGAYQQPHGAPSQQPYGAPQQPYGAPQQPSNLQFFSSPFATTHNSNQNAAPRPQSNPFGAPSQQSFGAPQQPYGAPEKPYSAPQQSSNLQFFSSPFATINNSNQSAAPLSTAPQKMTTDDDDFLDEPPLLEELGINLDHIVNKTRSVLYLRTVDESLLQDSDMAGPLLFALTLGFFLLLTGKVHFGYIYGFGVIGCVGTYVLVNLMSPQDKGIDLYRTMSILGYCLLPIVLLASISVVIRLNGIIGSILTPLAIFWCSYAATKFFESALHMMEQRWLVGYPLMLFYTCFALITVF